MTHNEIIEAAVAAVKAHFPQVADEFCQGHADDIEAVLRAKLTEAYEAGYTSCWDAYKDMAPYQVGYLRALQDVRKGMPPQSTLDLKIYPYEPKWYETHSESDGWNNFRAKVSDLLTSLATTITSKTKDV